MDRYNVTWETPSKDSSGSMPLGNGDIGLNVWMEENGDLLFYIGKTDAWNENARLLKLGRVRIKFFNKPYPFRQILRLGQGDIEIRSGNITTRIWVDAHQPVIRVETESPEKFNVQVSLKVWRDRQRELTGNETLSACGLEEGPDPIIESPDTILPTKNNRIIWYHRNPKSVWAWSLKHQGLTDWMQQAEVKDPILNRTFGGAIRSDGLIAENNTTLKSAIRENKFLISIHPLTSQTDTVEEWVNQLDRQIIRVDQADPAGSRTAHEQWWKEFWLRSYIRITGSPEAKTVSQGYALQRFINACGGRGAFPIKFNGSIFTVDAREPNYQYDADYRSWGGAYWFQNTRLVYWPMPASGDFDLLKPFFKMYLEALPFARYRTSQYFGHEGTFFPEIMYFWGAYTNCTYGWDRTDKPIGYCKNTYIHFYWSGALELITLMLDYVDFARDIDFLHTSVLPLAKEVILFYSRHFPRDKNGKIRLNPINCLEMWHDSVNPMPDVAGLHFILPKLLNLPDLPDDLQTAWQRFLQELPELPLKQLDGQTVLSPAEECLGPKMNYENPELYAIFPYRLYGLGKPDLETARRSYALRTNKHNAGWQQETIQAALLGLTEEVQKMVVERFSTKHPGSRFPAFWGPNYDWIPDQDHGGVAMMALQSMLLQAEKNKILLLPAWPKDWDVEFKLYAPENTTVEGIYRNGKWETMKVKPEIREKDITTRNDA
jgi:alpha-L-fucosidase 2